MGHSTQPVVEIDSDGDHRSAIDEYSSGETIYHEELINTPAPAPQATVDRVLLRRLEDKWDNMQLATIVRTTAQKVKRLTDEEDKHAQERAYEIDIILEEISRVKTITSRFAQKVTLKRTLNVLRLPGYKMSAATNKIAEGLFQEFERQNWGESVALATSTTMSKPRPSASAKSRTSRRQKLVNVSSTLPASASFMETSSMAPPAPENSALKDVKEVLHFDKDNPVFGNGGIMRGINVRLNKTKKKTSYFLDKSQRHKRANVVGHNSLIIGDCWPYMICLLRDGVHGSSQGGIYGTEASGAYSIIVLGSSAYADMDQDDGSRLFYSGSGSLENTDPHKAKETEGMKALQTSASKEQAVRVIRGKNDKKKDSPKAGFRYDGLYKVVAQKQCINQKGGTFFQFELRRLKGQPPINTSRPGTEEQERFRGIKLHCS
jgi:hypothetical protein